MILRRGVVEAPLILAAVATAALWPVSAYVVSPIVLPAVFLALGGLVLVLSRPEYGVALVLALIPLTNVRVDFGTVGTYQPLKFALPLMCVGLLAYGVLVARGKEEGPQLRTRGLVTGVLLFFIASLASTLQGIEPSEAVGPLSALLAGAALLIATLILCYSRRQLLIVLAGVVGGLLVAGGEGVFQQVTGQFSDAGLVFEGDAVGRISGSFGHPNQYGGFIAVFCPLAGSLAVTRGVPKFLRWLAAITLLFALPALALAYSRGAVGGLVVGSLLWLMVLGRRTALVAAVAAVVAALVLAPAAFQDRIRTVQTNEVTLRSDLWRSALDLYAREPVLGVGPGGFAGAYSALPSTVASASHRRLLHKQQVLVPPHANNLYLTVLAEQGIVGFLAFAAVLLGALRIAYRGSRLRDPVGRAASVGLGAGLLTLALHSLLEVTLLQVLAPLLALAAVCLTFSNAAPEAGDDSIAGK